MEHYLLTHPIIPAGCWIVLFTSDYYLTLLGSKLVKKQPFIVVEGSYEMTPVYERAIDEGRWFSWVFVAWLIFGAALLLGIGHLAHLTSEAGTYGFGVCVGLLLLPEIGVHLRHVENILVFRKLGSAQPGVSGQLTWSRAFVFRTSGVRLLGLAALCGVAFALSGSSVLLGGALGLAAIGAQHARWQPKQQQVEHR